VDKQFVVGEVTEYLTTVSETQVVGSSLQCDWSL
jgi:hypothetical protein